MQGEDPDESLILRVAAGDADALLLLVERHQAPVLRYLRALTASEELAEEALQETFLALWRGSGGFRGDGSGRAWLLGLARRQAARTWRRRAGQPARHDSVDDSLEGAALGLAAGWGDPHQAAVAHQDRDRLQAALDRLSTGDREIIVLRDLEQLSGPEAAELLHLSLAAQKSRLHRARLRLMAALRAPSEALHG